MNLSNISLFGNQNNNTRMHGDGNNTINMSLSASKDKLVESIQNQIERVRTNENFDEETKETMIEQLEDKLEEIKRSQLENKTQSLNPTANYEDRNKNIHDNSDAQSSVHGDTLEISMDARALIESEINLQNMRNSHSTKVSLQGSANILSAEIRVDRGRGVDTSNKEADLSKMRDGISRASDFLSQAMNNANQTATSIPSSVDSNSKNTIEIDNDANDTLIYSDYHAG